MRCPATLRLCFNPRARGGRDGQLITYTWEDKCFNPRARGGRDFDRKKGKNQEQSFNPRARGGRDKSIAKRLRTRARFNPRARGGRDGRGLRQALHAFVSIHAPAGGATWILANSRYGCRVSIHAPAGGATCGASKQSR